MNLINVSISISTSGNNTLITGVSGQAIRIRRLFLVNGVATAQAVTLKDGATDLTGAIDLPSSIGGGFILADAPSSSPWFVLGAGENFVINLSAATAVKGFVQYTLG